MKPRVLEKFVVDKQSIRYVFPCLVLLLSVGVFCSPFYEKGLFSSQDGAAHLLRIFATTFELQNGHFYPRWLSLAAYGKGLPDLNFYSPAFYLLISWLNLLGIPLEWALKGTWFVLSFLGGYGVYLWVRRYVDTAGALISATLYLFLPYRFLDLYVRGAFPEFAALSLLPWLFYSLDLSFSTDQKRCGIILTALTSSAIVLTHHLSSLMILPFAIVYFVWHAIRLRNSSRQILIAALGPLAGAGLSAFYWLPVLMEMKYLAFFGASNIKIKNPFVVWDHFVFPAQWFNSKWGFGLSVLGPNDGMSFQIGVVLTFFVILTFFLLPFSARKARGFGLLAFCLGLFGLLMTTEYSSKIYSVFTFLTRIQFPWRFLGPATLFLAAFSGLIASVKYLDKAPWTRWVILIMVFIFSIHFSKDQRAVEFRDKTNADLVEKEFIETKGITGATDFLPKWAKFDPDTKLNMSLGVSPKEHLSFISKIKTNGAQMTFKIDSTKSSSVMIPWYYFPGWQVTANDKHLPVNIDKNGFITFSIPAGKENVKVWFGNTWPRIIGWFISILTVITFCCIRTLNRLFFLDKSL